MRALIYARTSSCEDLAKKIIDNCKIFCSENQLDIKHVYFDIVARRSGPKSKYKEFLKLLENIEPEDCIVCERFRDLPDFFIKTNPTIPIRFPGDKNLSVEVAALFLNSLLGP